MRRLLELGRVVPGREDPDAVGNVLGVAPQRGGAHFVRRRFHGHEVGVERGLDVHDDVEAFREVHDHVRAQGAILARDVDLLLEVAMRRHACELHEPAQCDLAPLPPNLRLAEGLHEVPRFLLQRGLGRPHVREMLPQAAEVPLPLHFDLAQRFGGPGQRFLDRLHERLDRLLTFLQGALRRQLVAAEILPRQPQEILDVLPQLPAGEVVEAAVQLLHRALEGQCALRFQRRRSPPADPPPGHERDGGDTDREEEGRRVQGHVRSSSHSISSSGRARIASAAQAAGSSPSAR